MLEVLAVILQFIRRHARAACFGFFLLRFFNFGHFILSLLVGVSYMMQFLLLLLAIVNVLMKTRILEIVLLASRPTCGFGLVPGLGTTSCGIGWFAASATHLVSELSQLNSMNEDNP
jgi:hypothetical protein